MNPKYYTFTHTCKFTFILVFLILQTIYGVYDLHTGETYILE